MKMHNKGQGNKGTEITAERARELAKERLTKVYAPPAIRKRAFKKDGRKVMQKYKDRRNK